MKYTKYLNEAMISSKDPKVFKNIVHKKIKEQYDQVNWAIKNIEMDNMTKKHWMEVKFLLDKLLEKIVTV